MKYKPLISGENIYLSPISTEDADLYTQWLSNPRISVHTRAFGVLYTHEFEKNYLEKVASNADKSSCMLAFVRKKDNQIIGSGGFFGIDTLNRNAELGILIGDERLHGKGYGTEGIRLLLEYGFTMLNLHMIYLNYLSFNKRGEKLYEKCGFRHAGKLREARIIGNQKYDLIMMDILASEYQSDFLEKILAPPAVS